jgi:hypothetical protein
LTDDPRGGKTRYEDGSRTKNERDEIR